MSDIAWPPDAQQNRMHYSIMETIESRDGPCTPSCTRPNTAGAVDMINRLFGMVDILDLHVNELLRDTNCLDNLLAPPASWNVPYGIFIGGFRINDAEARGILDRWAGYSGRTDEYEWGAVMDRARGCIEDAEKMTIETSPTNSIEEEDEEDEEGEKEGRDGWSLWDSKTMGVAGGEEVTATGVAGKADGTTRRRRGKGSGCLI